MSEKHLPHQHESTPEAEHLKEALSQTGLFETVADVFRQLADTSRIRIFWLLCHCEECVINISALVDMTSPAVSHHLRQLKESGLIVSRRDGKEVYYTAADTEQSRLLHMAIEKIMAVTCPEQTQAYASDVRAARAVHAQLIHNLDKRITIEELSRQYHINPTTLKTVFKSVYGTSIAAHIREHRMEKAAALLLETGDSIAQIAQAVGYSSQSKFTAAFKEAYGVPPTEYRRKKDSR